MKALKPQGDTPQQDQAAMPALAPTKKDELRSRLVGQINAMADDANDNFLLAVFVEVAAWKLAAIAHRCGPIAAGDVIRQLGNHLYAIADRAEAQREADEAKAQGRLPQ